MADYKEKIESRFILQKEKEDKLGMETRKHDNGGGMWIANKTPANFESLYPNPDLQTLKTNNTN